MAKSFNSIKPLTLSDDEKKIGLNGGKKRFEDIDPSDYDFGVDSDYIDSFLSDASSFITNSQKDYGTINFDNAKSLYDSKSSESAELKSRANTIRAYLNANKDGMNDEYRSCLLEYLDSFESTSDSIFNTYRRSADYMKQFTSENDYQGAKKGKEYISKYDDSTTYSNVLADISELENERNRAAHNGSDTAAYDRAINMLRSYQSNNRDFVESMSVDEIKAQKDYSSEMTQQDREDYTWLADYNNGDIFPQNEVEGEQNRQKADRLTAYFKEKYGIDDVSQEGKVSFGTQTRSSDVAYFDEDGEAVTWEKYLRIRSAETKLKEISGDETTAAIYNENVVDNDDINRIDAAIDMVNLSFSDATAENNAPVVSTEEQQEIVDYLTEKYGIDFTKDMNEVLTDLNTVRDQVESKFADDQKSLSEVGYDWSELNYYNQYVNDKAEYQKRKAENEEYATEHPVAATLSSILVAPGKVFDLAGNIRDTVNASGVDETSALGLSNIYDDYNVNTSQQYTSTVSQNIKDTVKDNTDSDLLAWLASSTYSGVSSSVQSAMTNAACVALFGPQAGEVVALSIMGTEAAADGFNNAVRNGSNNQEALFTAVAYGVNEALFEKLSFDHLMKMSKTLDVSSLSNFIKSVLKSSPDMLVQGLIEADEEVNTDIANTIADYLINGNQNEYYTNVDRYINQGYSREEAEKLASNDAWKEIIESAYGGFIGGVTAGGGKTVVNTGKAALNSFVSGVERTQYTKDVGGKVTDAGNTQELINRAKSVQGNTKAAQNIRSQAEKLEKRTETKPESKKTVNKTGKLYASMQENNISRVASAEETEIKSALSKAYASQIKADVSDKSVSKVVNALYKSEYTNEPLTMSERNIVNNNQKAKAALAEVQSNKDVIRSQINRAQRRATEDLAATAALTGTKEQITEEPADIDISDFNVHEDDEKTYTADGSEQVDVGEIVSVGDNDVKVKLSNGKTESVKNLSLGSEDQAVIYQGIMDIQDRLGAPVTASFANAVVNEYKQAKAADSNLSTVDYIHAVEEAVRKGYMNDSGVNYAVNLSGSARQAIFDEGRQIAKEHTNAQQKAVQSRIKGNNSQRKGTVTYEDGIKRSQLNERQQAGVDVLTHIAEETGIDVVFFRSTKDGKGRFSSNFITKNGLSENGQAPNGFWLNGKMYIDVNAGMNGEGLILFTAAHEIVHMIREGSPEQFKALADFLVENYAKKGVDVNKLVLKEMSRSTNLNYDAAYEEVIAESCESFLRDIHLSDKVEQLYKTDKGLATKIKDILSRIVNAVKKWYGIAKPQSVEAHYVSEMKDALEEAYDRYIAGIRAASQNLRNMEKSTEGNQKNMLRDIPSSFEQNINSVAKMGSVVSLTGNEFAKGSVDLITQVTDYFDSIGGIAHSKYGDVRLTRSGVKASIGHGIGRNKAIAFKAVQNVLQEGLMIDYQKNWKQRGYNTAVIAAPITIANTDYYMAAVVIEQAGSNDYYLHEVILKEKENVAAFKTGTVKNGTPSAVTSSIYSILRDLQNSNTPTQKNQSRDSDYLSAVERGDMQTAQRMVDEAAKDWGAVTDTNGKPIVFYHGTKTGGFNEFRYDENKQTGSDFGKAFYFTTDYEKATGYAYDLEKDNRIKEYEAKRKRLINAYINSPTEENKIAYKQHHDSLYSILDGSNYVERLQEGSEVKSTYLSMNNPLIVDAKGKYYYDVYADYFDLAKSNGNDGIIVHNVIDNPRGKIKPITVGIVFDSSQIKSADPVTYDDNGEVIPLSRRFDSNKDDIRYQERGGDFFDIDDMFDDDDSIESTFAKEYATHHEDIGEVLRNIADIDIEPKKVTAIVNRVIRDNFGSIDTKARELLSTEIQIALENVNREDPETVINEMINAVRKAVVDADVTDDRAAANYSDLLSAFKGRKFYLTDEQINRLAEHDMTLNDYRKRMIGKITIVSRQNAKRSIDGGYADASELSLEGLYDMLESPEEYLPFNREQWDEYGYDAPYILMETMEKLRDIRTKPVSEVYSEEDIDYLAVALTAKITGGIVEEKYKSKYNGKDSQQIRQALKEQQKQTDDYISVLVDNLTVQHETQLAEQREKNKQKLAELKQKERARAEKREQELRAKYREQRARGYENRKRTEFRGKVKQLIGSFNTMLTHPVEGKYIPRGFVSQTIDILNAINTDSRRSEKLSAAIAELKVKYEALKADETGYASYNSAMEERLRVLSEMIEAEAEEWVPKRNKAIAYENKRAATEGKPLKRSVTTTDFSIQNMSLELLQYTYETLNGMRTVIRESMRMTGEETRKMRQQITDALISEIKGVRREHTNMLTVYGNLHKSGYVMFKSFADYKKNSEWENRQNELNKGQLETSRLMIEFSKPTLELIADKKNLDNMLHTKVDIGLKDADGNPVLVTHDMLVHIYLDLSNEHNAGHVAGDGYHVPDLELYYKGKRAKSFEGATSRLASGPYIHAVELSQRMKELDIQLNTALTNGEDTLSIENEIDKTAAEIKKLKAESDKYLSGLEKAVESKMTAYDYQWVEAWREFNDMAASAINNVTMQTLGFKKAVVDNYFPITVDKSFRAPDFDTIVSDMSLESWGSLKERVKGAKGAIVLQGITDVMADRIHKTALYCGMTIPVQNFRKVYGGTQYNFKTKEQGDDFKTSVQRELDKKFGTPTVGDSANVYIKKLIADLIESRNNSDNGTDKLLALARGGIAISTLTTNPRVWLVQAASLVSALPELDIKSVLKGTATIAYKWNPHYKQKGAATRLRMSQVTPLYDLRRMGMVDTELGDIATQRSSRVSKAAAFSQKILNLTQKVDSLTTGRIWFMCEYWVKDHKPNLREGTIEFDKAVAEKYNQVIERTQPNYTPMQRGQILRSKNAVTKLFTMWQTQRMQNVNMLFDAVGTLNRTIYDYNHGLNGVNRNDLKTAWYQAGKTTLAFLVSNAMIVAIQAATDMLIYRKFKKYSDDDDDLTTQSVLYGILLNYISTLTGNFFGGSELEDMISAVITGERYNEINPGLLGTLIEDVTSVVKTAQALQSDGVLSSDFLTNLNTAITNWCGVFGIPARNVEKIYDGAVGWIEKLVDKDLFQFSEIGSHVNKALNARAVNKIVNGDYSSVSVMTQDKYDEAYTKAWNKGKSEEDCQSAGRTAAKKAIANLVKETYLSTDDFETKRTIRLYMYKSGYYVVSSGKKKGQVSLDVVDRTLESWKNNQDEKDIEAQTAKERKYGK